MSDFFDESLLKDFFDEAYVQLSLIEENLLILEKSSTDKDAIDSIFRAAHTLKGNSAAVKMDEISKITHALEDAMDSVRKGEVVLDSSKVDLLLTVLDIIKNMVDLRNSGKTYTKNFSEIIDELKNFSKGSKKGKVKEKIKEEEKSEETTIVENSKFKLSEYDILELKESNHDNLPLYKVIVTLDESNPMRTVGGIQIFTSLREVGVVLKTIPDFEEIYSDAFHKEIMYIVASKKSMEEIKEYATIADTTEKIVVEPLDSSSAKGVTTTVKKETKQKKEFDAFDEKIEDIKKDIIDNIKKDIKSEIIDDTEKEDSEVKDQKAKYIEEKFSQKDKDLVKDKDQKSSSILRVDAEKIDALLNLVSEVVINKASHGQNFLNFTELLDSFYFTNNEYKDTIKQLFAKFYEMLDSKNVNNIESEKSQLQNYYKNIYNKFDSLISQLKNLIAKFKADNLNLDRISASLQEGVMRVRMVPINQIFSRFPRMVRDLSKDLKKNIQLVINGEDTEIDKAMIDYLMDPLIHMVRNAIDHGIENDDERKKLGKSVPAILELSAVSQGNIISISISDDGKGINTEKIKKKAIELGLIDRDSDIKDNDIYNLLFEPGFSTAEKVTSISGRGVGLDVVKKNIEKLNGTIKVTSELGMGTIFNIKIPLTLAIIQGLLVKVNEDIYSIPISSVIESMRIKSDEIRLLDNYEVVNIRDEVVSLLRINRLFKYGEDLKSDFYYIVTVGSQDKKVALLVDSIIGEEDIVIKPLRDKYTATPGISGATILGNGTVSLILDVAQLIELGLKVEGENRVKQTGR